VEGRNLSDQRVLNSGYNGLAFFGYAEGTYKPLRRCWLTLHDQLRQESVGQCGTQAGASGPRRTHLLAAASR
jgi:hypothetical protein